MACLLDEQVVLILFMMPFVLILSHTLRGKERRRDPGCLADSRPSVSVGSQKSDGREVETQQADVEPDDPGASGAYCRITSHPLFKHGFFNSNNALLRMFQDNHEAPASPGDLPVS